MARIASKKERRRQRQEVYFEGLQVKDQEDGQSEGGKGAKQRAEAGDDDTLEMDSEDGDGDEDEDVNLAEGIDDESEPASSAPKTKADIKKDAASASSG